MAKFWGSRSWVRVRLRVLLLYALLTISASIFVLASTLDWPDGLAYAAAPIMFITLLLVLGKIAVSKAAEHQPQQLSFKAWFETLSNLCSLFRRPDTSLRGGWTSVLTPAGREVPLASGRFGYIWTGTAHGGGGDLHWLPFPFLCPDCLGLKLFPMETSCSFKGSATLFRCNRCGAGHMFAHHPPHGGGPETFHSPPIVYDFQRSRFP